MPKSSSALATKLPCRPIGVVGRGDLHAAGQLGFQAIGRHGGRAAVARIILVAAGHQPHRIDDDGDVRGPRGVDHRPQDRRRARALGIVGDQHGIARGKLRDGRGDQLGFQRVRGGRSGLAVDAEDLVRVSSLSAAHEALFHGSRSRRIDQQAAGVDVRAGQQPPQSLAVVVVANDAHAGDLRCQSAHHLANVGGAAGPLLARLGPQHNDGRFLADAFGVAPGVAVEDHVAQHQQPRWPSASSVASRLSALMRGVPALGWHVPRIGWHALRNEGRGNSGARAAEDTRPQDGGQERNGNWPSPHVRSGGIVRRPSRGSVLATRRGRFSGRCVDGQRTLRPLKRTLQNSQDFA